MFSDHLGISLKVKNKKITRKTSRYLEIKRHFKTTNRSKSKPQQKS